MRKKINRKNKKVRGVKRHSKIDMSKKKIKNTYKLIKKSNMRGR